MAIVGVVSASFSLRPAEPNPCNVRLAQETSRIVRELERQGHQAILVVQWEIGLALDQMVDAPAYVAVQQPYDGLYLGTAELVEHAAEVFADLEVTHCVAVANPFVHQPYLYWLVWRAGYRPMWRHVRWVGFDKQSTQWWCRSWWQFLYQLLRLALGATHGHDGRQEH